MKSLRALRGMATRSVDLRYYGVKRLGDLLTGDYRTSWHQLGWWRDNGFNAFLRQFGELGGFNTHRRWMLSQLLRLTAEVPGDTAECGVYEGCSSWLMCAAAAHSTTHHRTHHLFDSFAGLSNPGEHDGRYWATGDLSAAEEVARRNLAPFEDVLMFHTGWIPDRFPEVADRRFSFVHVDVDVYQPTRDSLEFFYDRINPGGIFLCDDYGFDTCPGATKAVDEFLDTRPEKMLALDAGGGFFIKGTAVAPTAPPVLTQALSSP